MPVKSRLNEREWIKAFVRWRSDIVRCVCGKENLVDSAGYYVCDCGKQAKIPAYLITKNKRIPLYPGIELFACHTSDSSYDFRTKTGEVIANKNNPKIIGIRNLSDNIWYVTSADGKVSQKGKNEVVRISIDTTIRFDSYCDAVIVKNDSEHVSKKMLPIIFLIETSGGMNGVWIGVVNHVMAETIAKMQSIDCSNTQLKITVLEYGDDAKWVYSGLNDIKSVAWEELQAGGSCRLDNAFNKLNEELNSTNGFMQFDMFPPVIIVIALREPIDDAYSAIELLKINPWYQKALKAAITIGEDMSAIAHEFVQSKKGVIEVESANALEKAIPFLTLEAIKVSLDNDLSPEQNKQDALDEIIQGFVQAEKEGGDL